MRKLSLFISGQLCMVFLLGAALAVQAQSTDYTTRIPVGTLQMFISGVPDISTGWIPADGAVYDPDTYPELYALLGCYYGCEDGFFRVPNLISRAPVGAGPDGAIPSLTGRDLGEIWGEEYHTLIVDELPSHNHSVTDPGHGHSITDPGHTHRIPKESATINAGVNVAQPSARTDNPASPHITSNSATTGITVDSGTTGITIDNTGSGDPVTEWQPSIAVNFGIWGGLPASAPEDIVITVVVVFPTHTTTPTATATLTPTEGPSPTATPTATPTGAPGYMTSYTVGGQEVLMDYTVRPGDAFIGGLVFVIAGLIIMQMFLRAKRGEK